MGQEVSVSMQAVKSRVYKLIDALVEGAKTEGEIEESMRRWWKLIHPADRPMAQKYLQAVLEKSNASLGAINHGLLAFKEFAETDGNVKAAKLPPVSHQRAAATSPRLN